MELTPRPRFIGFFLAILALYVSPQRGSAAEYQHVDVRIGAKASVVEKNIAKLLASRLDEMSHVAVRLESESESGSTGESELLILLGTSDTHAEIAQVLKSNAIHPPTEQDPGPEGFLLKLLHDSSPPTLVAAGVDSRGCLYAVGEILRRVVSGDDAFELPDRLDLRSAPAFEIRGTQYGQSGVAKRLAHVRDWTPAETERVILDYALAGANIFSTGPGPMFDFIKSYGLMTQGGFGPNTGSNPKHPEWNAFESIGRTGYVCLSEPGAREFMLRKCESKFKNSPTYDLVKFHGGDGGGCECDRCNPYGKKFIHLVEKMAAIIHRYHPTTRVYFTNQKFDDEDDQAIFDYLNEKPRDWLWAWGYGPGSDATTWQPGHRQTHRMDLFRYPGFGPYGLYPKEILHKMPRRHALLFYNEITHWKYAQHAYIQMYPRADRNGDLPPPWSHEIYERQPDQALTMVYNRLSFYAWPRFYHRVFNDLMPYGIGDITHSSGHHDHFNQWMWQRLLWAPRTTVEEVVDEYCVTWFGPQAAPQMAEALFLLEENLGEQSGTPLKDKQGISHYYDLVKQAGEQMPAQQMNQNWLWRMHMQKAALDRYVQLSVRQQHELHDRVEQHLAKSLDSPDLSTAIAQALPWFDQLEESSQMVSLRAEAGRLGEQSNKLYGVRNDGYFNLEHDFLGLGWLERQLERAREAAPDEKREHLSMIIDYENPGEGGFYDNLGTANVAPHATFGYPYDHGQPYVSEMLAEGNRPSQRSMHFTQNEDQGVTLQYQDLDPAASYRIRFTLVRPWFQERYQMRMNQKSQTIFADEHVLAADVELPEQMSDFFTYEIPPAATRDGKLTIRFSPVLKTLLAVIESRLSNGETLAAGERWSPKPG